MSTDNRRKVRPSGWQTIAKENRIKKKRKQEKNLKIKVV